METCWATLLHKSWGRRVVSENNWNQTLDMFKELTETHGVPGNESAVRKVMEKYIAPYADEVSYDGLGSILAEKKGTKSGPKVMVAGHMDEIGFMVTQITDDGFLRVQPLGFWWTHTMLAQQVKVITRKKEITGVFGFKFPGPDTMKKTLEMKDMFVDISAESKEQAQEFGVRPGDMVVPVFPFTVMENSNYMMAKAWDNRIGCAIAIEVMKELQDKEFAGSVVGVGTVQEEVGCRGAKTATHVANPDIMFAVDVTISDDVPGAKPTCKTGKGPVIFLKDTMMIAHKGLFDYVINIAEENNIPYQLEALRNGGTDAGSSHLHGDGIPSLAITVPTRYIHSHAGILHKEDFENTVKLVVKVIESLNDDKYKDILGY